MLTSLFWSRSDPLPPTGLRVTDSTSNSMTIQWTHDATKSFCLKWNVTYTEKKKTDVKAFTTNSVNENELTLGRLAPGLTYIIRVFGVTTKDVVSRMPTQLEATVSKYHIQIYDMLTLHNIVFKSYIADEHMCIAIQGIYRRFT